VTPQVSIVGAGPGGLAAAMLLAKAGCRVRVFERSAVPGGRTSSFNLQGFRFDLGPTFFLYPRILREIFSSVGRNLDDEVKLIRLDPLYRLIYGDGSTLDVTPQIERMEHEIARLSPGDAAGYMKFVEENRRKFERFRPCLQMPFDSWRDLLRWSVIRLLPWLRPWASVDGELGRYFRDPRVRLAFTFQAKYLGMSPFKCPSLFTILSYLEHDFGVYHPIGGCAAVTARMAGIAEELGAEIHLQEGVERLIFNNQRVVGVQTRCGEYRTDAVVINADFARAMKELVPNGLRRRWSDGQIKRKKFSCSTFMLYLGLRGSLPHLRHHTIYLPNDYERVVADIDTYHRLSDDPALYVQNACQTDPDLAPSGHSTLYVLVPVTHQHPNVDWERDKGPFRARVLRQLRERLGIHDLERRIVAERTITPADWDTTYHIHLGATFNLTHNLGQMLHRRPHNRFEELEGVYLTGGGTHPGSGLPVIFESARIASRLLLEDFGHAASWLQPLPEESGSAQTVGTCWGESE